MKPHHITLEAYATLLRETYRRWREVRPELLAGGLSFFAVLSATPLLVILIGLLRRVVTKASVMAQLDAVLSPRMGALVQEWLLPAHGSGLATLTIFSSLVVLFSASQVFIQLRASLDIIWNVRVKTKPSWHGFFKSTVAPLLMILAAGLLVLAFILIDAGIGAASRIFGAVFPGMGSASLWKAASLISSLTLFALFFGGIYKLVPSRELRWREVWPGALLTSGLFALGKFFLSFYFSWISFDTIYGTTGSLIVIMIWVFVSAQIFFFGAVFINVYSREIRGSKLK